MNLVELPDFPSPSVHRIVPVRTRDDVVLRAAFWPATVASPRGTVLLLQGRAEFIEKYFEIVGDLLARGFAVAAFDWRGQGGSGRLPADRHPGHVGDFAEFRHDLDAVATQLLDGMPRPVTAITHSMGGCIALIAAAEGWLPASRLVASTPMLGLSLVRHPRTTRALVRWLAALGLSARMVPGGQTRSISTLPFPGNRLTGHEGRYARNAALATALGAGAIGSPTIGWLRAAYDAMARFAEPGLGRRVAIPVLIVGAGDDPVCSTRDAELFAGTLPPGSYTLIPKARHEVMMESDEIRAAFWDAFDAFLSRPEPRSSGEAAQDRRVQALVPAGEDRAAARS